MSSAAFNSLEDALVTATSEHRQKLLDLVGEKLRAALIKVEPSFAVTFDLVDSHENRLPVKPEASKRYAGTVINFLSGKPYEGRQIDSAVTPLASAAVEEAILAFYTDQTMVDAIVNCVVEQITIATAARRIVSKTVRNEACTIAGTTLSLATRDIQDRLKHEAGEQMATFFHSALGEQFIGVITAALATTAGKVLLINSIKVVVAHVMASTALQTAIITFIKKVGIGILIKTAVGKAIALLFAAVGIAHVPVFWIILPIIAAFLVYEYNNFPEKLANSLAEEIPKEIGKKFDEINRAVIAGMMPLLLRDMKSLPGKLALQSQEADLIGSV